MMKIKPAILAAYSAAHRAGDLLTEIHTAEKVTLAEAKELIRLADELKCAALEIKARIQGVDEPKEG